MKPELDALASSKEWRTMDRNERQDAVGHLVKDARAQARDEMPDALAPWQRPTAAPWESYAARR